MFCEQCEQTASGNGCHQWGACGKPPEVNAVQDLLIYCLRGIAPVVLQAREYGIATNQEDAFTCEALFATMTNVNFQQKRFVDYIHKCLEWRQNLRTQVEEKAVSQVNWSEIVDFVPDFSGSLSEQGEDISLKFISQSANNVDIFSLKLTVLYGVKGLASYTFHAQELGQEDECIYQFIQEALVSLDRQDLSLEDWVNLALKVGEINLRAMELLDAGHTSNYGQIGRAHV